MAPLQKNIEICTILQGKAKSIIFKNKKHSVWSAFLVLVIHLNLISIFALRAGFCAKRSARSISARAYVSISCPRRLNMSTYWALPYPVKMTTILNLNNSVFCVNHNLILLSFSLKSYASISLYHFSQEKSTLIST